MRRAKYQIFSLGEYQQRLGVLRSRMEQKGVDVMLVHTPENLHYLTGYQTPGYYWYQTLVVPMLREPVFITRLIESTNIEPLTWVEDSRPYEDFEDWVVKTRSVLVDLGLATKRIGFENDSFFLTSRDYLRLTGMLTSATFVDCSGLVEQGRLIKSPQEIEYMRQAARAAETGMMAGIDAVEVGSTENEVAAEIHRAQILAGSEYTGLPIFINSGDRASMCHSTWYRKRLGPNELVHLEIPGCINRYHAAMIRPVYLGDPPDAMVRAAEVVIDTLQKFKAAIKPGVKAGDVFEVVQENLVTQLGIRKDNRAAYSIGIAFAPDWGEGHILSIMQGEQTPLRAGMTFHLLTSVWVPKIGRVGCNDTVLVTGDGCETLTDDVDRKLYAR